MSQPTQTDDRLAARASAGDRRAFAAIFKRYHQDLFRYCAAILGNAEDAGEALQNTMVKVLGALPGERRRLKLKPWLYRIAHNESIELLRARRELDPIEPETLAGGPGPEASAETRERLRALIADLRELPERQRGALVMRELGGLGFEEIGLAFETSPAVARQTVYEARLGLAEMERGRAMECDEVRRKLSDGDRRVFRRRDVRAHLRDCRDCREFEAGIAGRRADLAAISPLPALAAAGLAKGVLGAAAGSATGGAAAGAGTLGGAISSSVAVKAAATVIVAGAIGVGAADRAGLVHVFNGGGAAAGSGAAGVAPGAGVSGHGHGSAGLGSGSASGGAGTAARQGGGSGARRHSHPPAGAASANGKGRGAGRHATRSHGAAAAGHAKGTGSANAHGANPHANGGHRGGASGQHAGTSHGKAGAPPAHAESGQSSEPHAKKPPPESTPPAEQTAPESPSAGGGAESGGASVHGKPEG